MMTKKQFIALADTIKAHNQTTLAPFTLSHQETLATFLKIENPRFNRQRWLDYIRGSCGPSGGKVKSCGKAKTHPMLHFAPRVVANVIATAPQRELSHAEKTRAELDAELGDW